MGEAFLAQKGGAEFNLTTNDGYTLLADYTVSGSAIAYYDITGLNITSNDEIVLVTSLVNPRSDTGSGMHLFINGNNSYSSYYCQKMWASGSTIGGVRSNDSTFSFVAESKKSSSITSIKLTNNGYFVHQTVPIINLGSDSTYIYSFNTASTFTTTSITSIRIHSEQSGTIGIGSRFQLYKRNGVAGKTWSTT